MTRKIMLLPLLLLLSLCMTDIREADAKKNVFKGGYQAEDFVRIGKHGFGDSANSYGWGAAMHKGDLYVGVNRHHLWSLLQGYDVMFQEYGIDFPEDLFVSPPADTNYGSKAWAKDFRAQLWRYRNGKWKMVHQAGLEYGELPIQDMGPFPAPDPPIVGYYPESYGYRTVAVYNDYIYILGIGTWVPNIPFAKILRSKTGDPGTWEDVSGIIADYTNPRGLMVFDDKLFISVSVPGAGVAGTAGSLVFYTSDPESEGWTQASEAGFGNPFNSEIYYLQSFNKHLFASTVNYSTGFEVWKTDGIPDADGKMYWQQIVKDGFGDTWNQYGMTMEVFDKYLYVGSATGGGLVIKDYEPVGTRSFDVIRIDKNDDVELVVGSPIAIDPPEGWPRFRKPLSMWPAGFGNILNAYSWHIGVKGKHMYLGTFDMTGMLLDMLQWMLSGLNAEDAQFIFPLSAESGVPSAVDTSYLLELLSQSMSGGDMWKTKDGIHWAPVTLNGLGNPNNYGFRRILPVKDALVVTTANPFTGHPEGGCEVWVAGEICQPQGDVDGDCKVNNKDLKLLNKSLGGMVSTYADDGLYTSKCDYNQDGKIDDTDITIWNEYTKNN